MKCKDGHSWTLVDAQEIDDGVEFSVTCDICGANCTAVGTWDRRE